jgi:hypothetical protein
MVARNVKRWTLATRAFRVGRERCGARGTCAATMTRTSSSAPSRTGTQHPRSRQGRVLRAPRRDHMRGCARGTRTRPRRVCHLRGCGPRVATLLGRRGASSAHQLAPQPTHSLRMPNLSMMSATLICVPLRPSCARRAASAAEALAVLAPASVCNGRSKPSARTAFFAWLRRSAHARAVFGALLVRPPCALGARGNGQACSVAVEPAVCTAAVGVRPPLPCLQLFS